MTDWQAWHGDYDDSDSSLSRRLRVVQQRLDELIFGDADVSRVLSLCAGDVRDIVPVLARSSNERQPAVVLVELDPTLAAAAERRASDAGLAVTVVVGDAGLVKTWQEGPPVDLLMLCGVLGNIAEADIRTTIEAARGLLTPGGCVIWTRGYFDNQDLRPQVREWFADAGFMEVGFDSEPTGYGVAVNRLASEAPCTSVPDQLFSFVR